MVGWFFDNFEDPAQETPYNGREGGYLFIHGGPYEAQNYIPDAFPDATEDEHIEAIDRIDAEGPSFAPAGHRVLPPDEEDDERYGSPPLAVRLDALGGQLEEVRAHVQEMLALQRREHEERDGPPPAGHNNPPDDDAPNLHEVLESVGEVERELAEPNRETEADADVVVRAESRFRRFLNWVKGLIKESPTLAVKGAITGAGAWATNYALNHQAQLVSLFSEVTGTLAHWAGAVTGIF